MIEVHLNGTDMLKLTNDEQIDIVATDGTVLRVSSTSDDRSYFVMDPRASQATTASNSSNRRQTREQGTDPQFWMRSKLPRASICAHAQGGPASDAHHDCALTIHRGDVILYDRANRKAYCKPCGERLFASLPIPEGLRS